MAKVQTLYFQGGQVRQMYSLANIPSGWSGGNMGPRPLGPRRNRRAAGASRQSFKLTD